MVDIEAIGVAVDTSGLKSGERALDSFGRSADQASRRADAFSGTVKGVTSELAKFGAGLLSIWTVAAGAKYLVDMSDKATLLAAKLKLATSNQKEFNTAIREMQRIAGAAQSDITSIATLYNRLSLALRETGKTQQQVTAITETVALALRVGGASAAEASSTMLQLSQSFGSGVLRGQEFNAVMEAGPGLMRQLAQSMGVPIGQLRALAEEGRITSDELTKAFTDTTYLGKLKEQAHEVETAAGAWEKLKNEIILSVGELNKIKVNGVGVGPSSIAGGLFGGLAFGLREATGRGGNSTEKQLSDEEKLALSYRQGLEKYGMLGSGSSTTIGDTPEILRKQAAAFADLTKTMKITSVELDNLNQLEIKARQLYESGGISAGQYAQVLEGVREARARINKSGVEEQKRQIEMQQEYMRSAAELGEQIFKLAEPEKTNIELLQEKLDLMTRLNPVVRESMQAALDYAKALEQENAWHQVMVDSIDREIEQRSQLEDVERSQLQARSDALDAYSDEMLKAEQDLNISLIADDNERVYAQIELERQRRIDYLRSLDDQTEETHAAVEAMIADTNRLYDTKHVKAYRDSQKGVWDAIEKTAHDTFISIFDSGKSAFDRLRDTLKNGLLELLWQMMKQKWTVNISAAASGVGASGAALAAGESGGIPTSGGGFGSIGSIFETFTKGLDTANATFLEGIESFGANVAKMGGVFENVGGWISENSALLGDIAPFVPSIVSLLKGDVKGAIASGIGAGIGFAIGGPVGGAIGSALGSMVGGMFGSHVSRPKYYANTSVSSGSASTMAVWGNSDAKGSNVAVGPGLSIAKSIDELAKAFGGSIAQGFVLGTKYMQKYNSLEVTVGQGITKSNHDYIAMLGNDAQSQGVAPMAFFLAVRKGFVELEPYMKRIINQSTITIDTAAEALTSLGQIKQAYETLAGLPAVFNVIRDSIENTLTLDTLDQFKARLSAVSTYYSLFYSDQEKLAANTQALTIQYQKLNLALPESRDAYRALVEGIDTSTSSGLELFDTLVGMAPAMDAYYKALQQQKDALNSVVVSAEKYANVVDFNRASMYAKLGIDVSKLPSYDVGTSFVPQDGPAMIHQGERILTDTQNEALVSAVQQTADLGGEIRALRSESKAGMVAIAGSTAETAKTLRKWENEGLPETRTV